MNIKKYLPENIYLKLKDRFGSTLYYMPKIYACNKLLYDNRGYGINWKDPKGIEEKQRWLLAKSYGRREAPFADKYRVRSYIEKCGYGDMLPQLYGVYRHAKEIDIDKLPDSFVLKANHDCGSVVVCKDKLAVDNWNEKFESLEHALHINYANRCCEYHYKYIKRRLIAEEYLEDGRAEMLTDYKIHCFYGKPHCIEVITDRATGFMDNFMDLQWNYLDYVDEGRDNKKVIEKPGSLEKMLEAAQVIGRPFPYARLDFYDVNGKAYFGEITLTPSHYGENEKCMKELGALCELPGFREILKKKLFGYNINNLK